jgi:lipopolysaccharide/colanic/teichoic acid biosynthesis glycosyltransferase
MLSQHPFTLEHPYALPARPALPWWKRGLDLACCVAGLPVLGCLTLLSAAVANGRSRGPLFYRQENVGHLGRKFLVYRFRTMRVAPASAPGGGESRTVAPNPASMLPVGRFLRHSGLADLPQLVNVLRGEMSIVGPRPHVDLPGRERTDMAAVPGITGLWRLAQVSRASTAEAECWEASYAARMSIGSDLRVIARSLVALLGSRRAP